VFISAVYLLAALPHTLFFKAPVRTVGKIPDKKTGYSLCLWPAAIAGYA
jgi:hypothetical protein